MWIELAWLGQPFIAQTQIEKWRSIFWQVILVKKYILLHSNKKYWCILLSIEFSKLWKNRNENWTIGKISCNNFCSVIPWLSLGLGINSELFYISSDKAVPTNSNGKFFSFLAFFHLFIYLFDIFFIGSIRARKHHNEELSMHWFHFSSLQTHSFFSSFRHSLVFFNRSQFLRFLKSICLMIESQKYFASFFDVANFCYLFCM